MSSSDVIDFNPAFWKGEDEEFEEARVSLLLAEGNTGERDEFKETQQSLKTEISISSSASLVFQSVGFFYQYSIKSL